MTTVYFDFSSNNLKITGNRVKYDPSLKRCSQPCEFRFMTGHSELGGMARFPDHIGTPWASYTTKVEWKKDLSGWIFGSQIHISLIW